MITVTKHMVRDHLTFKGPLTLAELTEAMGLSPQYQNRVQISLLDLQVESMVDYNLATGEWESKIVLE